MSKYSKTIFCKVCGEFFSGLISYNIHLETESRTRKVLETAAKIGYDGETLPAAPKDPSILRSHERVVEALYCVICDVRTSSEEPMLDHFKSKKHKKYLHYHADVKKHVDRKDFDKLYTLLLEEVELKKRGIFKCSICSVYFNNKRALHQHLKSENHYQRRVIISRKEMIKIHEHDFVLTADIKSL